MSQVGNAGQLSSLHPTNAKRLICGLACAALHRPGILSAIGYKTEYVQDAASNNIKPAGCKVAVVLECSICQCILSDCVPSCNVEETF